MPLTADRVELGSFLRTRRDALQPEDVGLHRGPRRRTQGLRREEVADLCSMSVDYVARLERGDGPLPSGQMAGALARGLRLTLAERDHLFRLCGHPAPDGRTGSDHVNPGLMRVIDQLKDIPAQVMGLIGETLVQTSPAVALLGEQTQYSGRHRSATYRWFTDPAERMRYLPEDHDDMGRTYVSLLRTSATRAGRGSVAAGLVDALKEESPQFVGLWDRHEIDLRFSGLKRFAHPQIGRLDAFCQMLVDPDQGQVLLLFTAEPGSESYEKLSVLGVLGSSFPVSGP